MYSTCLYKSPLLIDCTDDHWLSVLGLKGIPQPVWHSIPLIPRMTLYSSPMVLFLISLSLCPLYRVFWARVCGFRGRECLAGCPRSPLLKGLFFRVVFGMESIFWSGILSAATLFCSECIYIIYITCISFIYRPRYFAYGFSSLFEFLPSSHRVVAYWQLAI